MLQFYFLEYMKDHFSDTCLAPNFLCLRLVRSDKREESVPGLAGTSGKCGSRRWFLLRQKAEPIALSLGSAAPGCTKPSRGKSPRPTVATEEDPSVTLPGAVLLTGGLGSFAGVLQRQRMWVPEQIGRVSF